MCDKIVINSAEKEIGSLKEFIDHFGIIPQTEFEDIGDGEFCLCGADIEYAFEILQIPFTREYENDAGDFYINQIL